MRWPMLVWPMPTIVERLECDCAKGRLPKAKEAALKALKLDSG